MTKGSLRAQSVERGTSLRARGVVAADIRVVRERAKAVAAEEGSVQDEEANRRDDRSPSSSTITLHLARHPLNPIRMLYRTRAFTGRCRPRESPLRVSRPHTHDAADATRPRRNRRVFRTVRR